jgi:hypothetical protein
MVQLGIRSQQDNLETLRLLIQGAIDREIEQLRLSLEKSDILSICNEAQELLL